jgi:hypothetical protein
MIMIDQSKRLSQPLRWGRRERAVVGALLVCVVLAVAGLGAFALTSGDPPRRDCIDVTFASTVGAATEHACGERARRVCASPSGFHRAAAQLREACRRAGFPFG